MGYVPPKAWVSDPDPEMTEARHALERARRRVPWLFLNGRMHELREAEEALREVELARQLGVQPEFEFLPYTVRK